MAAREPESPLAPLLQDGVRLSRQGNLWVDTRWRPVGVTEQFLADADVYHERYHARADFEALMDRCFALAGVDRAAALAVLDIGSGSGSSVFASASLLPNARIVASDISPQLLAKLADFVGSREELRGRVTTCCFDLHEPFFRPGCFDLVVGAAILHHLLDPHAALKNVVASLKPGGSALLVEPLEAGWLVMCAIFEKSLAALQRLGSDEGPLAALMRAIRRDVQARLGVPAPKPWTAVLDDKWVFDEPYLASLGRQLQVSRVEVHPAAPEVDRLYESTFRGLLAESGNAGVAVPEEVLAVVREFDRGIAPELKRRLPPTGIIVLSR